MNDTSMEGKTEFSIFNPEHWDDEIIRQAVQEHQFRLSDRQKKYIRTKRVMDTVIAAAALLILSAPILLIVAMQKWSSPSEPVFFLQERLGLNGKKFRIVKFRTMKSTAPSSIPTGEMENPQKYISRFGAFLRRTSLDELPQLWNVVRGEMSIVGPRPLLESEHPAQYLRKYYGVNAVRPGITGLAQVNGRDALNDIQKVQYDRAYLRNVCFRLDTMILLKTVVSVAKQDGIVEGKGERVPRFAHQVYCNVKQDLQEVQKADKTSVP